MNYFSLWKCQRCDQVFRGKTGITKEEADQEFDLFEENGSPTVRHDCGDGSVGVAWYVGYEPDQTGYQVKCAICHNFINETGTMWRDRPVHIGCYHKAEKMGKHLSDEDVAQLEEIRKQFQEPGLFKPLRQHAEQRGVIPASIEEHKKDRVPFIGKEDVLPPWMPRYATIEFAKAPSPGCVFQCNVCGWNGKQLEMHLNNGTCSCPQCRNFNFAMIDEETKSGN